MSQNIQVSHRSGLVGSFKKPAATTTQQQQQQNNNNKTTTTKQLQQNNSQEVSKEKNNNNNKKERGRELIFMQCGDIQVLGQICRRYLTVWTDLVWLPFFIPPSFI